MNLAKTESRILLLSRAQRARCFISGRGRHSTPLDLADSDLNEEPGVRHLDFDMWVSQTKKMWVPHSCAAPAQGWESQKPACFCFCPCFSFCHSRRKSAVALAVALALAFLSVIPEGNLLLPLRVPQISILRCESLKPGKCGCPILALHLRKGGNHKSQPCRCFCLCPCFSFCHSRRKSAVALGGCRTQALPSPAPP